MTGLDIFAAFVLLLMIATAVAVLVVLGLHGFDMCYVLLTYSICTLLG